MATFLPKKFLISLALTALGHWSAISWWRPIVSRETGNTLDAHG